MRLPPASGLGNDVRIPSLPARFLAACVGAYQRTLSPDHGPLKSLHPYGYCRHEPTCSEYAKQQLLRRGAVIGSLLAMKRLLTCHPWRQLSDEKILKITR